MKLAASLIESYIIYSLCASYWFFYRLQYNEGGQSLFKCEAKFAVQTFNAQKSGNLLEVGNTVEMKTISWFEKCTQPADSEDVNNQLSLKM